MVQRCHYTIPNISHGDTTYDRDSSHPTRTLQHDPPNLNAREGHYFTGSNQKDAIDKATIRFGSEVIDVQLKSGEYLGAFKRVEIHGPDEHFIQLPHTIPDVGRLEQLLTGVEGPVSIRNGVITLEDGTQIEIQ